LRWKDIDLESVPAVVHIEHNLTDDGEMKSTKTNRARTVPIDDDVAEMLRQHRLRAAEKALAVGAKLTGDCFVFSPVPASGAPFKPHSITTWFRRLRRRLGIEGVTPHSLRHYCGTALILSNVDARTVADRLGHSRPSTTLALYTHTTGERDVEASRSISRRVLQAANGETGS
jgi:integrase